MDRLIKAISVIIMLSVILTCQSVSSEALQGEWRAATVVEEGDTLDLDLRNVQLVFSGDNFNYQHTQRDSMSGKFDLSRGLIKLYVDNPSTDTIIIQLNDIHPGSLELRMNHEGKERLVTMIK